MLRRGVLLLLLLNGLFLAWSQGWLAELGPWAAPMPDREPQRLQQQLLPERVVLVNSARGQATPDTAPSPAQTTEAVARPDNTGAPEAQTPVATPNGTGPDTLPADPPAPSTPAAPVATASGPTSCVQAGVFDDEELTRIRPALDSVLTASGWETATAVQPGRWVLFTGKLPSAAAVAARRAELRQLKIEFRDVNSSALQPGLVLGTFSSEAGAEQGLRDVTRKGVKGIQVLEVRPDVNQHTLRLPRVTDAQKQAVGRALTQLEGDLWKGKAFKPCA